ncbi:MAG: hypothetical protein M0Z41_02570 [Peptococcaceae bacterium]|nr:hypothetical protein [Peptococcaceae bacterium]
MPAAEPLQRAGSHSVLSDLQFKPHLVKTILQEHKDGQKRTRHLGRRTIGRGLQIFLWGLRIYVFAMLLIVLINVFR